MAKTELPAGTLRMVASSLLSAPVEGLEAVGGGRNSRIYRLRTSGSRCYALKVYFRHPSDTRNRLETEFGSLAFLWRNGIRNIPQPIAANPRHNCAIYSWIDGRKIDSSEANASRIDAASSFLARLSGLRALAESHSLPPASEAHFSGATVAEHVRRRLQPLVACANSSGLKAFLNDAFIPALEQICQWSRSRLGETFDADLPWDARTLSPSDFGFHNALESPAGEMFFLDLEYFGWDDPAKMISDFLLHPAMDLPAAAKQRFTASLISYLAIEHLTPRVEAFYPLFGLKWCLILLNEFLPEPFLRRQFAGMSEESRYQRQSEQLAKAEHKLRQIQDEYEHFPYLT